VSELDPDERDEVGILDAMGRVQKTIIISEPGLYNLSKRSNKPGGR
jgi:prophage antirepressor-like protein